MSTLWAAEVRRASRRPPGDSLGTQGTRGAGTGAVGTRPRRGAVRVAAVPPRGSRTQLGQRVARGQRHAGGSP